MAKYDYGTLKDIYRGFSSPHISIEINGEDIMKKHSSVVISDIDIDLSAGYEASVATFCLYNVYDTPSNRYDFANLEKFLYIGSTVNIATGYDISLKYVFVGVITKINFLFNNNEVPYIQITCMDVKGVMMANNYSKQLTATAYSDAVAEIFDQAPYKKMKQNHGLLDVDVAPTPDSPNYKPDPSEGTPSQPDKTTPPPIEMVSESDYEFVVKVAKRFNYDFFVNSGIVMFRPAKADTTVVLSIAPYNFLRDFDIEYDITSQVAEVEVRATDAATGKLITASKQIKNDWSLGSKAADLVKGNKKVYLDSTVRNEKEAGYRVNSLVEEISYRFGTLSCETLGVPEMMPGTFIEVEGLGSPVNNTFYIHSVRHVMTREGEYKCIIKGQSTSIVKPKAGI